MEQISNNGGNSALVTPSTRLLNQKLGTSCGARMLTTSEIELLRRSKKEIAEEVGRQLDGQAAK